MLFAYFLDSDGFPSITYNQSTMRKQAMNQEFLAGLTLWILEKKQGIENAINKMFNLIAQSFAVEL